MFYVPLPLVPVAPALIRPPFHRDGWVYEEKVDGWRMLAYKEGSRVRLISRRAVDHSARFRELVAAIRNIRADVVVLDGEVAVYDEKLVSRFHLLGDDETGVERAKRHGVSLLERLAPPRPESRAPSPDPCYGKSAGGTRFFVACSKA